jgi:hypothetical protein
MHEHPKGKRKAEGVPEVYEPILGQTKRDFEWG